MRDPGPRFVTFEGIDGSGKSTLVANVARALRDRDVDPFVTREETEGWLGAAVKRSIQEKADPLATLYLFLADRAHHLREVRGALDAGRLVLSDRYHDSTRAYQSVTLTDRFGGRTEFDAWLERHVRPWLLVPHRTFLVDLDADVAVARMAGRKGRTDYEQAQFLGEVREAYLQMATKETDRWRILDGRMGPEDLVAEVLADLDAPAPAPRRAR